MSNGDKLTPKQAAFVREYLIDLNATQAAIRAKYSAKTAGWIGPRLVTKSHIAEAIAKEMENRAAEASRTALDVLRDIQAVTSTAREGGDLKTALKGLELEGKHLGMFKDRQEVTGTVDHVHSGSVEIIKKIMQEIDGGTAHIGR